MSMRKKKKKDHIAPKSFFFFFKASFRGSGRAKLAARFVFLLCPQLPSSAGRGMHGKGHPALGDVWGQVGWHHEGHRAPRASPATLLGFRASFASSRAPFLGRRSGHAANE